MPQKNISCHTDSYLANGGWSIRTPFFTACVLSIALLAVYSMPLSAETSVRIAFLGERDSDAFKGALQGVNEANTQGKFLGLRYDLVVATDHDDALALGATAIVADVSAIRLLRLAEDSGGAPVFNVSAEDDALRDACQEHLFHTIPSDGMRDDALQQWARKRPDSAAEARAWHPKFKKYAAAQLNRRYTEAFGQSMTDISWAGWAATKLLSDTIARIGSTDADAIAEILSGNLAFDGQKGITMSFRNTGQLRQPILLIENDAIVAEAPVRGIVDSSNLDSLGLADCLK